MSKLSIKHEAFVNEYMQCFNGTKAYLKVYPDSTEEAACSSASELLRNPKIKEEITSRINTLRERIPEDIIQHLKNLVFFNISDLLGDDGEIDTQKIKENSIPGIVSGITVQRSHSDKGSSEKVSFKLTDQNKAIELMSKILKLYDDAPNVNVTIPPININFSDDAAKCNQS